MSTQCAAVLFLLAVLVSCETPPRPEAGRITADHVIQQLELYLTGDDSVSLDQVVALLQPPYSISGTDDKPGATDITNIVAEHIDEHEDRAICLLRKLLSIIAQESRRRGYSIFPDEMEEMETAAMQGLWSYAVMTIIDRGTETALAEETVVQWADRSPGYSFRIGAFNQMKSHPRPRFRDYLHRGGKFLQGMRCAEYSTFLLALASNGDAETAKLLAEMATQEEVYYAQHVSPLALVPDAAALRELIGLLESESAEVRSRAAKAIEKITGEDIGNLGEDPASASATAERLKRKYFGEGVELGITPATFLVPHVRVEVTGGDTGRESRPLSSDPSSEH